MKKALLFIVLALLLLFASCGEKEAVNISARGSDPGNIALGGIVTEDEDFVYYAADHGKIYKSNKDFSEIEKIADGLAGASYLNISGNHLYFINGSPGFVYKMNKNGSFKRPIILKQTTNVIVSGDRIYYMLSPCDGPFLKIEQYADDWGSIYSCDLNGRDKKLISKEDILRFVVDGDYIYYSDENYFLWRMDTEGNNVELINSAVCSLPEFDEKYLYYTSEGKYVYRMDKVTLDKEVLAEKSFEARNFHGDWVYYTQNRAGDIYRMSKDGKTNELLLESDVVSFYIADNSVLFELYNKGFYRLDTETKELTKLSD